MSEKYLSENYVLDGYIFEIENKYVADGYWIDYCKNEDPGEGN